MALLNAERRHDLAGWYHGATTRATNTPRARGILHMASLLDRITMDPAINHGKPVIRGLRYPVEMLLELMSAGMTIDEILADYEDLERDDLLAALAFAARISQVKRMEPIGH